VHMPQGTDYHWTCSSLPEAHTSRCRKSRRCTRAHEWSKALLLRCLLLHIRDDLCWQILTLWLRVTYPSLLRPFLQLDAFERQVVEMVKPAHGTTTLGFIFQGGIIIAVDSRATMGGYICERL
jgi:hypothetical protein